VAGQPRGPRSERVVLLGAGPRPDFTPLGSVRLTIDGTTVDLAAGEQVRFPGEAVVAVVLSRPTRALNVMTRRGRCVAQVALRPADAPARGEGTVSVDLGERIAEVRVTIAPRL